MSNISVKKLKAVQPNISLGQDVYEKILLGISDMTLAPGQRITQDYLADVLNVSRQPVGPALLLLEFQGFVEPTGRRGRIVSKITRDGIMGTAQLLASTDSYVVGMAARQTKSPGEIIKFSEINNFQYSLSSVGPLKAFQLISRYFLSLYDQFSGKHMLTIAEPNWIGYQRCFHLIEQTGGQGLFDKMQQDLLEISDSIKNGSEDSATRQTRDFHKTVALGLCDLLTNE